MCLLALIASLSILPSARADANAPACTSTENRYGAEVFAKVVGKYPKAMGMVAGRGSAPIPGLVQTVNRVYDEGRGLTDDSCGNMVPH